LRRIVLLVALLLTAGCGGAPAKEEPPAAAKGAMGVARLMPKNGSNVRGFISFTQSGDKVAVAGDFYELFPGSHSIYIHEGGNCSSPNAASAGPVWNVPGNSGKRTGALPEVFAGSEGRANISMSLKTISVGTGKPDDVIGHSVVIYADVEPDPKAEFGVANGRLACGVVQPSTGLDLKKVL
jgi:superoxide dismutase, Cu-Zn family